MAYLAAIKYTETPSHSRRPGNIRVKVSFMTGAVRSAILATAGLLVPFWCWLTQVVPDKTQEGRKTVVCVCDVDVMLYQID